MAKEEFDLARARQSVRIKGKEDAAAGRLLGTIDGVRNWLRLQGVPESEREDLIDCYVEAYDDATGLEMTDDGD